MIAELQKVSVVYFPALFFVRTRTFLIHRKHEFQTKWAEKCTISKGGNAALINKENLKFANKKFTSLAIVEIHLSSFFLVSYLGSLDQILRRSVKFTYP